MKIIYLHGFNSSSQSHKGQLLVEYLQQRCTPGLSALCPQLPSTPLQALATLEQLLDDLLKTDRVGLIGSSLGGYFATYLAEQYRLPAVVINPAVRAYELLAQHLGEQHNPYTGETYQLCHEHIAQLKRLERLPREGRYLLLQAQDDEVLDWQAAVAFYQGHAICVEPEAGHLFSPFPQYLPLAVDFLAQLS